MRIAIRWSSRVSVLPSPDGSSAFLVGELSGVAIVLPRGEFTLTLKFNPAKAGLPPLRPSVFVGPGSELVTLRFLQPFGKPWPLPSDDLVDPELRRPNCAAVSQIPARALDRGVSEKIERRRV